MPVFGTQRALLAAYKVLILRLIFCALLLIVTLLVLMCQWFAPTQLIITFATKRKGAVSQHDIERYIIKDHNGNPVALDLPTKFVLIANHQVISV
jgi:cell division protein FtsI/penicillin-binding protein 2